MVGSRPDCDSNRVSPKLCQLPPSAAAPGALRDLARGGGGAAQPRAHGGPHIPLSSPTYASLTLAPELDSCGPATIAVRREYRYAEVGRAVGSECDVVKLRALSPDLRPAVRHWPVVEVVVEQAYHPVRCR